MSPDGKNVAVGIVDDQQADVWVADLSGASAPRRLTFAGRNRYPVWSGNGRRIAFQSDRGGAPAVFAQQADGTGTAEQLTTPDAGTTHTPESWSPDGNHLLFSVAKAAQWSLWTLDVQSKKARPFDNVVSSTPPNSVFSPDGRWIAYTVGTSIYIQPFPETGAKYEVIPNSIHPTWSPDGTELLAVNRTRFRVMSIVTRPTVTFATQPDLSRPFREGGPSAMRPYDVVRDGQHFIAVANPEERGRASEFRFVLNWFEELKTRAPVE